MFDLLISKAFAETPERVVGLDTLDEIIRWFERIINHGFTFFAVFAVGAILYAAFLFLFSGGDDKKLPFAKSLLKYSLLAIILVALARTIPHILRNILNI